MKEGDLLAQIDPRPSRCSSRRREGQLARDRALLENAQLDLERYQHALQAGLDRQAAGRHAGRRSCASTRARCTSTRRRSTTRSCSSPTRASPRRSAGASACARSIRATSCTPATPTASSSSRSCSRSRWSSPCRRTSCRAVMKRLQRARSSPVEAWDREQKTKLATARSSPPTTRSIRTTGTVKLKAQFANADGALFPNQFVNVRMLARHAAATRSIVPAAAVQRGAQGMFVYVVQAGQHGRRCAP